MSSPARALYFWLAVPFIIVGAVVALALLPNGLRKSAGGPKVSALLILSRTQVRMVPDAHPAPVDPAEFEEFRRRQAVLVRSQVVLNAALNVKGVANLPMVKELPDPLAWLAAHLRVDFPDAPEVMRIGLDGGNVEELKVLVNAVMDAYFQEVVNKEVAHRVDRIRRLDELAAQAEESLNRKRVELGIVQAGFGGPDSLQRKFLEKFLEQDLMDIHRELLRVRMAQAAAEARSGKEADALAAQEKFLRDEETKLLATAAAVRQSQLDVTPQRFDVEQAEALLKRIRTASINLKLEMDAPPRVRELERAVVRAE